MSDLSFLLQCFQKLSAAAAVESVCMLEIIMVCFPRLWLKLSRWTKPMSKLCYCFNSASNIWFCFYHLLISLLCWTVCVPLINVVLLIEQEKGMFRVVQTEKCAACQKTVYAMEKLEMNGNTYHKNCFKCSHCSARLT